MKKIEYPFLFLFGSILYCLIEIIWRGRTHWTMGVAGGVCLFVIYSLRKFCPDVPLWIRCAAGAASICAVEFTTGFVVNIMLGWAVWDYSDMWLNIYGQICPLYAVLWFVICIPGNYISSGIQSLFSDCEVSDRERSF